MSQVDRIKEILGWLKVVFAALIVVDVSLIAWLAQNFRSADVVVVALGFGRHRRHYRRHHRCESAGVSLDKQVGASLMIWFVVAAVVIFIGGMLVVVYDAVSAGEE